MRMRFQSTFIRSLILVLTFCCVSVNAVAEVVQNSTVSFPALQFDTTAYDFGVVKQDDPVKFGFKFRNAGKGDLILESIKTSCGCTAASSSSGPFKPGESSVVEASYTTSGKFGHTQKEIKVFSNDPRSPHSLMITGTVTEASHPMKATGEFLFAGSCAECHAKPAKGKQGKELYDAACFMCHDLPQSKGKNMIASDQNSLAQILKSDLKRMIANGLKGTSMPGFATKHGGPLSKDQIQSLVDYIQSLKK